MFWFQKHQQLQDRNQFQASLPIDTKQLSLSLHYPNQLHIGSKHDKVYATSFSTLINLKQVNTSS